MKPRAQDESSKRSWMTALVRQWRWMAVVTALLGMGWGARSVLASVVTRDAMTAHEKTVHAATAGEFTDVRVQLAEIRAKQEIMLEQMRWLGPEIKSIGVRLGTRPDAPPPIETPEKKEATP